MSAAHFRHHFLVNLSRKRGRKRKAILTTSSRYPLYAIRIEKQRAKLTAASVIITQEPIFGNAVANTFSSLGMNQRTDTMNLCRVVKTDRDLNGANHADLHPFHCHSERIHTLARLWRLAGRGF